MTIDALPPEILIRILSYLPLQAINSFNLVSKFCHDVVSTNDNAIYQTAATFHDFIESPKQQVRLPLLTEVVNRPDAIGWLDNVTSWKELCRSSYDIDCFGREIIDISAQVKDTSCGSTLGQERAWETI